MGSILKSQLASVFTVAFCSWLLLCLWQQPPKGRKRPSRLINLPKTCRQTMFSTVQLCSILYCDQKPTFSMLNVALHIIFSSCGLTTSRPGASLAVSLAGDRLKDAIPSDAKVTLRAGELPQLHIRFMSEAHGRVSGLATYAGANAKQPREQSQRVLKADASIRTSGSSRVWHADMLGIHSLAHSRVSLLQVHDCLRRAKEADNPPPLRPRWQMSNLKGSHQSYGCGGLSCFMCFGSRGSARCLRAVDGKEIKLQMQAGGGRRDSAMMEPYPVAFRSICTVTSYWDIPYSRLAWVKELSQLQLNSSPAITTL